MSYNKNFDLESAIDETKSLLEQQNTGIDAIKNHARDIFTSISLIVALFGILKLDDISYNFLHPSAQEWLIISAGFLYLLIISLNICLLSLVKMSTPMKIERKTFEKLYFNQSPKHILENKLANYLRAVKENESILEIRFKVSRISDLVYVLILMLLLFVILVS